MSNSLFRRKDVKQAIKETEDREDGNSLAKVLGVRDLTLLGIAAIILTFLFSLSDKPAEISFYTSQKTWQTAFCGRRYQYSTSTNHLVNPYVTRLPPPPYIDHTRTDAAVA